MKPPQTPKEWTTVPGTEATWINFGPVQLYCFPDPHERGYRWKVGSLVSDRIYSRLTGAQNGGLRYLEKLGERILEGVRSMPEYEGLKPKKKKEPELDDWHLSILNAGKPK